MAEGRQIWCVQRFLQPRCCGRDADIPTRGGAAQAYTYVTFSDRSILVALPFSECHCRSIALHMCNDCLPLDRSDGAVLCLQSPLPFDKSAILTYDGCHRSARRPTHRRAIYEKEGTIVTSLDRAVLHDHDCSHLAGDTIGRTLKVAADG